MALTDQIANYWKLDEASGNAADSVGSRTLTNTGTQPYATGKINNGIKGNNSGTIANTTNNYNAIAGGAFTIGGWYNPSASSTQDLLIGINDVGQNLAYHIFYNVGATTIHCERVKSGVSSPAITVVESLSNGTWYHILFTFDGSTGIIYFNGANVASGALSGAGSSDDGGGTGIGCSENATSPLQTNAMVDEVGIWTRALSAGEVSQLYNSSAGLQYPFTGSAFAFHGLGTLNVGN